MCFRSGFKIDGPSGASRRRSGPRRIPTHRTHHRRRSWRRPCRTPSPTWSPFPTGSPSTPFAIRRWRVTGRSSPVVTPLIPIIGPHRRCYRRVCPCRIRPPPRFRVCWRTYRRRSGRNWCAARHPRRRRPRPRLFCRILRSRRHPRRLRRPPRRRARPRAAWVYRISTGGLTASPTSDWGHASMSCSWRCRVRTAIS